MEVDFPEIDFGSCCCCERENKPRNLISIPVKGPVPGKGWGCYVCGLPCDGAIAVVCDECLAEQRPIKWVIYGWAAGGERVLLSTCAEPFGHDLRFHGECSSERGGEWADG